MVTLAWVENEIEKAVSGANTAQNIYDLAALVTVRNFLAEDRSAPPSESTETAEEKRQREAVILTAHSADLDTIPTIDQVESAMGAVVVNTPQERERMQRMQTWGRILRGDV